MEKNAGMSAMLVTALAPHIGYDRAARIARRSIDEGVSIREAALASGWLTATEFDAWADPWGMAGVPEKP
jgi:fumarate hydratase class II